MLTISNDGRSLFHPDWQVDLDDLLWIKAIMLRSTPQAGEVVNKVIRFVCRGSTHDISYTLNDWITAGKFFDLAAVEAQQPRK